MANPATIPLILCLSTLLLLLVPTTARAVHSPALAEEGQTFFRDISPALVEEDQAFFRDICGGGKQNAVHLRVYVHDLRIGHVTPTVFEVGKAYVTDDSPVGFGSVHVLDDLLTAGPDIGSAAVGRIQGLTTNADMSVFGIAMNLNFFFTAGKFNGSTISILGRNQVMDQQRELPVVGGTGVFRFAKGYAIQTSVSFDQAASYAVLEYNIYVTYNAKFGVDHDMEIAVI